MPSPDVSLIICCYRQRLLLDFVLRAAVAQQVNARYEILVCDDGSDDQTFETVRELAQRGHDIRYLWQPDHGFRVSRSRNTGIRCAQGRILVFLDGDTWPAATFLRDHVEAHAAPRTLACGARQTLISEACGSRLAEEVRAVAAEPLRGEVDHQRYWLGTSAPWMACLSGNFSIERAAGAEFDESFETWGSEDRDLAFRLWRGDCVPRLIDICHAVHVRRPGRDLHHSSHADVVALLRNKRLLSSKYPSGEVRPALELVRHCYCDVATGRWGFGTFPAASIEAVFAEFAAWEARQSPDAESTRSVDS